MRALVTVLSLVFASGCAPPADPAPGDSAASSGSEAEPTPETPLPGCAPAVVVTPPSGIDLSLDLDANAYRRDQSVGITIRTKNLENHPMTNQRTSAARAVFWVISEGRVIWRSDVGRMSATVVEEDTFTAGEAKTESVFWTGKRCNAAGDDLEDGTLARGHYEARGGWWSENRLWGSTSVPFEVR